MTDVLALFRDLVDYVANGIQAGTEVDVLVEGADFSAFRTRWLAGDARQEAMFRAFFLEPALRSTYAAMVGA